MKRVCLLGTFIVLLLFVGCFDPQTEGIPVWLSTYISQCEADTSFNPDRNTDQIWQYEYKGDIVFYFMSGGCDFYNWLYNYNGNLLGAPDGGYTGLGDGTFTDWAEEKTNGMLIWIREQE